MRIRDGLADIFIRCCQHVEHLEGVVLLELRHLVSWESNMGNLDTYLYNYVHGHYILIQVSCKGNMDTAIRTLLE